MKKILAVIISVMMVMTMVPSMAFAAGAEDVATSLPEAVDGKITLDKDVVLTSTHVFENGNNVIDLNGHNITGDDCRAIHVKEGSLSIEGTGTITSNRNTAMAMTSTVIRIGDNNATADASLVIGENVTVNAPGTYGVGGFGKMKETITVKGKIFAGPKAALGGLGSDKTMETGADLIVEPTAVLESVNYAAIYHPQNGKLVIKGGKIKGVSAVEMKAGELELIGNPQLVATGKKSHNVGAPKDGMTTSGYALAITKNTGYGEHVEPISISGGNFEGAVGVLNDDSETVAPEDKAMLKVAGGTFDSLDALDYTDESSNIKIKLANDYADLTKGVEVKGTVELDLNGHTIKSTAESAVIVRQNSDLTVKDSGKTGRIEGDVAGIKMGVKAEDNQEANSRLEINGGHITGKSFGVVGNGLRHKTEIIVNGGEIVGTDANDSLGIYHPQDGKLTVNGGKITGVTGIEIRSGELEVNGGEIVATGKELTVEPNGKGSTTKGAGIAISQHTTKKNIDVTVSGGKVEGAAAVHHANPQQNPEEANDVKLEIKGGEFESKEEGKAPVVTDKKDVISGGKFTANMDKEALDKVLEGLLTDGVELGSDGTVAKPTTPPTPSVPSTPEVVPPTPEDVPPVVEAPSKVRVLKAVNEKGKAALRWSRATNGPDGYRIYRAKTKDGKYSPIAWVKDGKAKTFKEKAKKTNKTYYYKVRAYKNVDGKKVWGEYSPIKKLKF